jgi:hypothetical protein
MNVYLVGPNQYAITWNKDGVVGTATLERSDHLIEGWVTVADVTGLVTYTDDPIWIWDTDPQTPTPPNIRSDRGRTWYYRIIHDGTTIGPGFVDGLPDPRGMEMARLSKRHLQRDIQTQAYLVRRPTYGEHCTECWDARRQEVVRSQCNTCDGSGRLRGYATAQLIYISFAPEVAQPEQMNTMRFEQAQIPMWTSNTPVLAVGDFLIRKHDLEVIEIVRWKPTLRRGFILRQTLIGQLVEKADHRQDLIAAAVAG